jgi:hypothetical protein
MFLKTAQEWTYAPFMIERIKSGIFNRVRNEWAAVKKAPLAMMTLTFVGGTAGFFLASARDDLTVKRLSALVAANTAQIEAVPEQMDPVKNNVLQPKKDTEPLFQFRKKVGVVETAKIDEEHGMVYFQSVLDATKLNPVVDFEYKDYVLHLSSADIVSLESISENKERKLGSVKCLIVGRLKE